MATMSEEGLTRAVTKMREAGVADSAINVFTHYYGELERGATGLIAEDSIEPLTDPPQLADTEVSEEQAREALSKTVVIKLNGGLGTSMGMDRAKSLLPVADGRSFLDLICQQVLHTRAEYDVDLPLLLMNSFRTRDDTLEALKAHPGIATDGLPADFLQNFEPKLRSDDLTPVEWPADPSLEWCPPGHGDVYTALLTSGVLETLLQKGYRYATVSNSDNLGAAPNARIAGWFAGTGAPYAAELCRRTKQDRKGGHLAVRKSDGQLILRDTGQTAEDEMVHFTDEHRHPYFHTNNLWWDLEQLQVQLTEREGVLGLPMIRNVKNVDPSDADSPEVIQVETAMGAAIEVFSGATAIAVGRERFLPVKTTNELLLLRSDVYEIGSDGRISQQVQPAPLIELSKRYKKIGDFDDRFPDGPPSLERAQSLAVKGDWTFGEGVSVVGAVELPDTGGAEKVADGQELRG